MKGWLLLAGWLCVCSLGGCNKGGGSNDAAQQRVTEPIQDPRALLEAAILSGDWKLADRYAKPALIADPNDPELITSVAKVNAMCDRKRDAAHLMVDAAVLANFMPVSRVNFAVQTLIEVGEVYAAIDLLEQSLAAHPEQDQQRRILVGFLNEVQRTDQIAPHLRILIQNRAFDLPLLVTTTETSSRRLSENTASRLLERNPADHRVRLAEAFIFLYRHDARQALKTLEDILKRHPDFAPAHAMYGQTLVLTERWDDLPNWFQSAPARSADFSNHWLTLGDMASHGGDLAAAVRAYWEATRRDPNDNSAWDRLRYAIVALRASDSENDPTITAEQLSVVAEHANALLTLREHFHDFTGGGQASQTGAEQIARSLLSLGRVWEAEAWSAAATTLTHDRSSSLAGLRDEIMLQLAKDQNWISKEVASQRLDLAFMPAPRLDAIRSPAKTSAVIPKRITADHVMLQEQSERWGLRGVGQGNNPTNARLAALIRSTGVGGGAIDYDLDGLMDMIMMNAGGTMLRDDSMPNQLLRNLGEHFIHARESAGVGERGFGQGVAVGDYNEDGFPDLFFANLGVNRLLRNNGDGSFSDCTTMLHDESSPAWSTSASFVDIDGDAIADLLVTNYCKTVPHLDQACPNDQGVLGPCHPLKFPAEYDQFFQGTGTGEFRAVTGSWVERSQAGRGLGIVAGTLDGQQLGIYVANDMSRNELYTRAPDAPMKLIDSASARGLAVDGLTRAQASMGIASGDFDLDGDLDLYVTGFAREYNVYYEQISPGMWKDETAKVGLVDPTLSVVGFGTQAVDLDADGIDEIIVTNGHIGDFASPDAPPYEQPFQLFRRGATGRFEWIEDDSWGEYFRTPHVGRAVWTTDVNRDGRNDVMITHTHEQVRLLVNQTDDRNHRIGFKLIATRSSRDAVGAIIRFRCNGQPRTLWMLSGDGYFCSNERTLIAGLEQTDQVTDVNVTWQDGTVDRIGTLAADQLYLIIQSSDKAFSLLDYPRP